MRNLSYNWYRIAVVFIILAAASLLVPRFASYANLLNLTRQVFLLCLIAYGICLSMLVAGLDLSIGSVAALSSCLAATWIAKGDVVIGILIGLAAATFLGLVNGLLISGLKVPDFIMTFSMMYIARGLALTYTQGESVYDFPRSFTWIGKSFVGPIPMPAVISFVVLLALYWLMTKTAFGRTTYAVGVNKEAARFSGLSVKKNLIQVYTLSGFLSGLAGLVFIARFDSADANLGPLWPLDGIAVCVIGGITFFGGEGNVLGLLLGGLVLAVIDNCVDLLGIPPRFQDFLGGFVIILAVAIDHHVRRRGSKSKAARQSCVIPAAP
jgi:ribose transport system permease protein